MTNRRIWIKQVLIAGGGVLLIPACINGDGAVSVMLKNIEITAKEESLLAELAETIIPATDTLGAKALNLHQFVLKMFDDCYDKTDQTKIVNGLKQLNPYGRKITGKAFNEVDKAGRLALLRDISKGEGVVEDLKFFLKETRTWVIKGFNTSEYVMTKLIPYEQVPGRFHGCFPLNKAI
jgi:hypothetical protein